ncbi:hypothetical protein OG738_38410 [Amycolatopsis sp. NBC_01488]|uniref:hypothetical protein n=1 Tax=Amycolatopsis sp. NBC_01488 TaxID=2903563 RepID=UPI002E2D1FC8|nr:hypothetical protein [Amycolatopsis sp. NBC_01488]
MTIGHRFGALAAATAGLLATTSLVTGTAANAEGTACYTTAPVQLAAAGAWSYAFRVQWCAHGPAILAISLSADHQVLDPACTWLGTVEQSVTKTPDGVSRVAYNRSAVSCPAGVAQPWATVTVSPENVYTVDATGIDH